MILTEVILAIVYWWKRMGNQRRKIDRPEWKIEKIEDKDGPQLRLVRKWFTEKSTIGKLFIDGHFKCYVLEDPVRDEKIKHITAIPHGTYEVIISYSNKFKKYLPLLLNVPNYRGIRIHPGNVPEDTSGCLLPGMERDENNPDRIFYSRKAFQDVLEILRTMTPHEKVYIEITNEREK